MIQHCRIIDVDVEVANQTKPNLKRAEYLCKECVKS